MDQRVSLRRFILSAVLTGVTLCGTLGWSSVASAREPAGSASKVSSTVSKSPAGASRTEARVSLAPPRMAPASRAPSAPLRTSVSRSTVGAGAGTATRSVSTHMSQGRALPSYADKKTWSH